MKTIILPGYSPHNKEWAKEVKDKLQLDHEIVIHQWRHWVNPSLSFSLRYESDKILGLIQNEKVNIIAKSVGTRVAMVLIPQYMKKNEKVTTFKRKQPSRLNEFGHGSNYSKKRVKKTVVGKLILCGIPTRFQSEAPKKIYSQGLSLLSPGQVIIFQNCQDPLADYKTVANFISSVNPEFKVIEKSRSDHAYPYFADFQKFLSSHL